jgi:hypothetical protein
MERIAGQDAQATVFAAQGPWRHRLVRAATAALLALLAAWLIALALGVMGGFGSLPGLPDSKPSSNAANSQAQESPAGHSKATRIAQSRDAAPQAGGADLASASQDLNRTPSEPSPIAAQKIPVPKPAQSPTGTVTTAPTVNGQGTTSSSGTTQSSGTTGKPVGSPGNGAGGSGAPGQLR